MFFSCASLQYFYIFAAEQKLKDKLAVAARDKLAQASKEKQLQAERKRKAAMFISMLKSGGSDQPQVSSSTSREGKYNKTFVNMSLSMCDISCRPSTQGGALGSRQESKGSHLSLLDESWCLYSFGLLVVPVGSPMKMEGAGFIRIMESRYCLSILKSYTCQQQQRQG